MQIQITEKISRLKAIGIEALPHRMEQPRSLSGEPGRTIIQGIIVRYRPDKKLNIHYVSLDHL